MTKEPPPRSERADTAAAEFGEWKRGLRIELYGRHIMGGRRHDGYKPTFEVFGVSIEDIYTGLLK